MTMSAQPQGSVTAPVAHRPEAPIGGPSAWRGEDLARSDAWMLRLDDADVAELDAALAGVEAGAREIVDIGRDAFPLPRLGARLAAMREEVLRGRGFALVRGLPMARLSTRQAAIMYWGIGTHLGKAVSQNAHGHLLGHVIDIGRDENDPNARIYQTNARQYFHADSCDIVGLLCLRKARTGGESTIVSSVTLFNEMLARAPDLVDELFRPFHVDRRGEVPEGANPWYEVPIFNWHEGLLSTYYVRRYINSARRFPQVPPLTQRQIAAFDAFDAICDDPRIHLSMAFEPGDMQFLHNHQILHDRNAYTDFEEPDRRRHLLRLWLCPPDGRPLPPAYRQRWGSIAIGDRGGIRVPGQKLVAPLEP
jgi:hypothetical protein